MESQATGAPAKGGAALAATLLLGLATAVLAAGSAHAAADIAYGVLEPPGKATPTGARMIARSGTEWTRVADCHSPSTAVGARLPLIANPGCKLDGPGTMPIDRKLARMQPLRRWFSWVFIDHAHSREEETLQALVEGLEARVGGSPRTTTHRRASAGGSRSHAGSGPISRTPASSTESGTARSGASSAGTRGGS